MNKAIRLYHGSHEIIEFPEIRKSTYTKDFSWGSCCTDNLEQEVAMYDVAAKK